MGLSPRQPQWGLRTGFERGQLPLSSSVQENKLSYSSASDMMTVKHNTKKANTKNAVKAAAAGSGGHVHKVLKAAWHLDLEDL
jgi:hypothetical protein